MSLHSEVDGIRNEPNFIFSKLVIKEHKCFAVKKLNLFLQN